MRIMEILIYKRERLKQVANQTLRKAGSGDELETGRFQPALSHGRRIAGNSSERTALSVSLVYAAYGANVVNQNPPPIERSKNNDS